jgi:hypothetical protein
MAQVCKLPAVAGISRACVIGSVSRKSRKSVKLVKNAQSDKEEFAFLKVWKQ